MSKNLEKVIERAISDMAFRRQLHANPEAALRGFNLTDAEVAAISSADPGKLASLGIDQRMSKAFTLTGNVAGNVASRASADNVLSIGGASLTDTDAVRAGSDMLDPGNVSTSAASVDTVQKIRDVDPVALGAVAISDPTAASDAIEDRSHAFAAGRSADIEPAVPSAVRDIAPSELQGSGLVAPVEGSPEAFAFQDTATAPTSDQLEDMSHAIAANQDLSIGSGPESGEVVIDDAANDPHLTP